MKWKLFATISGAVCAIIGTAVATVCTIIQVVQAPKNAEIMGRAYADRLVELAKEEDSKESKKVKQKKEEAREA